MSNNTDYRMVKLVDGSTIMGTITVDKDFLRITNALELHTSQRITEFGAKEDSTLAPWLQFTDDKTFVIPRPALSAEEMEKIYRLADQMDQMQRIDQRESPWSEQDLIDLFSKKTIH